MSEGFEERMKAIAEAQENYKTQGMIQSLGQMPNIMPEQPGAIKEQLSLGEELETIDYLIRSYTLVYDEKLKKNVWEKPKDEDQIILSDYGVHYFRQLISAYINKNTLLSNYDEDTILTKMLDLTLSINDDLFLLYNEIFLMPTIERCKQELNKEIDEKLEIRKIAYELLNIKFENKEEKKEIVSIFEYELEEKINKIRKRLFKAKLKRFNSILRYIQDIIHSAYNRALNGQERRSLRQHMQITETSGGIHMPSQEKKGILTKFGFK